VFIRCDIDNDDVVYLQNVQNIVPSTAAVTSADSHGGAITIDEASSFAITDMDSSWNKIGLDGDFKKIDLK